MHMTKRLDNVWKLHPAPPEEFVESIGYPPFQAQLLYNRGIRSADSARAFLRAGPDLAHDPFLLPDMDKAVHRLRRAMFGGDVIGVFGDFDTDGVSGAAIVVTALRSLGMRVEPYLPHRVEEGHGLTLKAVDHLESKGVSLLITVDNGVSSRVAAGARCHVRHPKPSLPTTTFSLRTRRPLRMWLQSSTRFETTMEYPTRAPYGGRGSPTS